eukprot:Blabericola_migrator_1__9572@NODE_521_length_7888_cov_123_152538_g398_i0_p1_GENE_NODE_521_length_7888_cov_123_152538_g398_i0NODE_521_length_7888_cov_123_152538_g398_i0_p1_ORF_typecomplete_len773_score78_72CECR6_TMEM121/PF14997_6/6_4e26CECR6_TMEM121/PF14997_6/8_2e03_NODE_521_length_7888_cov_123_152538_g398_i019664284
MFLWFLLLLVYAGQAVVINYALVTIVNTLCLMLVAMDAILFLQMTVRVNNEYAATNGSYQWLFTSWLFLIRLMILYFYVFRQEDSLSEVAELGRNLLGNKYYHIAIYSAPIMYALFMFRAAYQLFGPPHKVLSVESMIHIDIIFHVVMDLIDLLVAFSFCYKMDNLVKSDTWVLWVNGITVGAGWFMHSYSFPTGGARLPLSTSRTKMTSNTINPESDVFLARKQVALVSIFLVDFPLLFVRMYIWIHYPLNPGLDTFLFKNIVSIPLSTFRLNQCRTAEKNQLLAMNELSSKRPSPWTVPFNKNRAAPEDQILDDSLRDDGSTDHGEVEAADYETSSTEGSDEFKALIPLPHDPTLTPYKLQQLLEQIECMRSIPVKGFGWQPILKKLVRTIIYGSRHSIPTRLNNLPPIPTLALARLCVIILLDCLWPVLTVFLHVFPLTDETTNSIALHTPGGNIWMGATAGGFVLMHFLCCVGSAPLLDVLFTSAAFGVSLVNYWLIVTAIRLTSLFNFELTLWQEYVATRDTTELILLVMLVLPSLWRLYQYLPYIQMVIWNRRYAFFVIQKPNTVVADILRSHVDYQPPTRLQHDEQGFISVSAIMVFIACKRRLAPVSFHELLMGPDIMKSIRLCDVLLTRDWMLLVLSLCIGVIAVIVHTSRLLISFAAVNIGLMLIYFVSAQSVRLLVLRRYELQEIFSDILAAWETLSPQADPVVSRMLAEGLSTAELMMEMERLKRRREPSDKFVTLCNIVTSLRRHGLLTSPGPLAPPFI